jgi:hypothetical protein
MEALMREQGFDPLEERVRAGRVLEDRHGWASLTAKEGSALDRLC